MLGAGPMKLGRGPDGGELEAGTDEGEDEEEGRAQGRGHADGRHLGAPPSG